MNEGLLTKFFPVFYIMARDLYGQLRKFSFLVQVFILPLLLTLIIGNALGSSKPIEPARVGVVAERGQVADSLAALLEKTKIAKVSRLNNAESTTEVLNGRAVAMVDIPKNFDSQLLHGKPSEVRVLVDPGNPQRAVVISQVVINFFAQLEVGRAASLAALAALHPEDATSLGRLVPAVRASVGETLSDSKIKIEQVQARGRSAGFFTYYAIAFGIMFTMLTATNGASGLVTEFESGTLTRLLAAPLAAWQLAAGKLLSLFAVAFVQFGVFALATHFLFGVYWGSLPQLLVALPVAAFGAAGLGGIVLALAQSHEQVNVISLLLVLIMSLLGGSMWPIESMPETTQWLSRFTLNRWVIEMFQTLPIQGLGLKDVWLNILIICLMGCIGLLFGARRLAAQLRGLS